MEGTQTVGPWVEELLIKKRCAYEVVFYMQIVLNNHSQSIKTANDGIMVVISQPWLIGPFLQHNDQFQGR